MENNKKQNKNKKERTLVILKPDALQRGLVGEIVHRFERKGIKLVGMKMIKMSDLLLDKHYAQHKGKHFLPKLKKFMKYLPVFLIVLEGLNIVSIARNMAGPTDGKSAPLGTIRGDFGMSVQGNLVHTSEDQAAAKREIRIFFKPSEIFDYQKPDEYFYYADDEI